MLSLLKSVAAVALLAAGAAAQSTTTPVTGKLGDAAVQDKNPAGAGYVATINKNNVQGSVLIQTGSDNVGGNVQISLSGLPSEDGPFTYHIHEKPVVGGNCTTAGAHLDPMQRGETPICDPKAPQTCQVGDLAGKWGKVMKSSFSANYVDKYLSTEPGNSAFFGNLSVVVHYPNKTRIACANFELYNNASSSGNSTSSATSSGASGSSTAKSSSGTKGSASSSASAAVSTGAASGVWADTGLVMLIGSFALLI